MAGFLRRVLPARGWLCAATPVQRGTRSWWRNTPHADVDGLAARLRAIDTAQGNAYMALAGFRDRERPHDNPAKAAKGGTRFYRTQENAAWLHSLWLDIDIKPARDDAYPTRKDAAHAITRFIQDSGLPWPLVVNSGHGFHLYWPFSEDIPQRVWLMAATVLKVVALGLGLKVDHACTTDASRVLRPVGTSNRKDPARPRPVELVTLNDPYTDSELGDRLVTAARPYKSLVSQPRGGHGVARANGTAPHTDTLLHALDATLPKSAEPIITGCRQIRDAPFQREDIWRGMLSVLRLCQQGDGWCHAMSKRDARYRREDTDAKLAVLARQQGDGGMPMTCAVFNGKRPGICERCVHHGLIRSPIVLGLGRPLPGTSAAPALTNVVNGDHQTESEFAVPHTFAREVIGMTLRLRDARFELVTPEEMDDGHPMGVAWLDRYEDDSGNARVRRVPLTHQPVYVKEAAQGYDSEGREIFDYWTGIYDRTRNAWYEIPLSGKLFSNPLDLQRELYSRGVTLAPGQNNRMVEYMRAYIDQIRQVQKPVAQHVRFGSTADGAFVSGNRMFRNTPAGVEVVPVRLARTAASMARWLEPAGTLDAWRSAANLYAKPGLEPMAFALFTAFGAPLLHFTESPGFLVHLVGESGTGKTSLQRIAAAVWGNPQLLMKHAPTSKYGSTRNALMAELGVLHNLPLMFDEIALTQPEEVFPLLHALASGQEKDRMTATLDVTQGHTWQSIYLSSANRSLRAMLTATTDREHVAVLNRLLEVPLPSIDPNDRSWIDDQSVVSLALGNYGHAGEILVQWMVANAGRLPALIRERQETLMRRANAGRDERLWFASLAAIFTGAGLAKAAGLHDIDVAGVEAWVADVLLPDQRREVADSQARGGTVLAEFLNDSIGSTVIVAQSHAPADASLATDYVIRDIAPGGTLKVRYEQKSGRTYIARAALRDWCRRRRIDYPDALADMQRHSQLVKARCQSALGRGLPKYGSNVLRTDCLCVQASDDMMGVDDDDDSSAQ